ncbi:MAG: hypothetical protein IT550_08620 [Novosphingobium sp.]|nr:hypothetical protein [Novosphingobium sp.]
MAIFGTRKRGAFSAPPAFYTTPGTFPDPREHYPQFDATQGQGLLGQTLAAGDTAIKLRAPRPATDLPDSSNDQGIPPSLGADSLVGSAMSRPPATEPRLPDFRTPTQPNPATGLDRDTLGKLVGEAPTAPKRDVLRDVLAGLAAVTSDAANRWNGDGGGHAVDNLAKMWGDRASAYKQQFADFQQRQKIANLPGMTAREFLAYQADPKAWGSHMSDAATSRYQAATLNPGDQRVYGDPSAGGTVYQAPTRGAQYSIDLGLTPGTPAWVNAVKDQELGANGPTAFSNQQFLNNARAAVQAQLERQRQTGRLSLEGVRQGNRSALRGAPTYRDTHGAPPRASGPGASTRRTATDANGNRVEWNGTAWVPAR